MDASIQKDDDDFFNLQLPAAPQSVKLSHLNNKSSVLCPKNQDITSQYLALQQLDAHQKMIARAKGIVDCFAPRSTQSYISVVNNQKKKLWRKSPSQSKSSELKGTFNPSTTSPSRNIPFISDEEDNASLNASSVNRAIQTGIPLVSFSSNTDDKITWYLEALRQGELLSPPFVYVKDSDKTRAPSSSMNKRKSLTGDILETHVNCFSKSKKSFSPRIVADTAVKSKIKEMRCYQPPLRRKKKNSENSSDTFESYHGEDSEDDAKEEEKNFNKPSEDVETQINRNTPLGRNLNLNDRLQEYLIHQNRSKLDRNISNGSDEDKYLEFLSKVTEHILRSGIYSDRAIQQAFEFHLQFYQEENKDKLQSLLSQVMENMKISSNDIDDMSLNKSLHSPFLSRPNTPPVKELSGIFPLVTESARNEESTEEYSPSLSSQAQNVEDLLSDPHLLSDSGISSRQTDS